MLGAQQILGVRRARLARNACACSAVIERTPASAGRRAATRMGSQESEPEVTIAFYGIPASLEGVIRRG